MFAYSNRMLKSPHLVFSHWIVLIGSILCLPVSAQNLLEQRIQQKIDAMTPAEKMLQLHRNSFWTTADNNRLNIPGFTMSDGPHGVRFVDATSFPVGIGIAASWNRELASRIGQAMGREFHAYGKHQQLGPSLDICRDPRNGRSPETGGEDPFLIAHMNIGLVAGIQESPVIATIKHFNAVNKQVNRHQVNHNPSYRQLMGHYGYNFRRVMQDAGVLSIMNAYNRIGGDKCAENSLLLTHILRRRWGFPFYVVSDWGSVFDTEKALKAGCDLEMDVDESEYEANLQRLYSNGSITDIDLDRAVRRVLRVKYLLGMMDNFPTSSPFLDANTPEHQQLALEAGREAIVLLKNDNDILPITDRNASIALIGPSAQVAQLDGFGSSWVDPPYSISPLQGIESKISAGLIQTVQGCEINSPDTSGFAAARVAAANSNYVIFVGGLDQTQEGENYWPGPVDRTGGSVELPQTQQLLINELAKVNPNVIVVLKSGGICAVPKCIQNIKGFLYAFYPGMEGGNAIADVLYGDYNPSGKLPVTMPVNDAQMPAWNDDFTDDYNCGYRYYDEMGLTPQYAFGHGLSYTQFQYSNLQISSSSIDAGSPFTVSVEVMNTGTRAGEEVAQLYVENQASSLWMPKKELKGFEKVRLDTGEKKTVEFELTADELYQFNPGTDAYEVAAGNYVLHVGGASDVLPLSVPLTMNASGALPDLGISQLFHYPRFPQAGDSVQFFALVKNTGTKDVLPGTAANLLFEVEGVEVSSHPSIDDTIFAGGALLIGATLGPSGSPLWLVPSSGSSFNVSAFIDQDSSLSELIETNNSLSHEITIPTDTSVVSSNLCLNKPVTATSSENSSLGASKAVDGDFSTRWSSNFSDPQSITVDLQGEYNLDVIALSWETAYSSEYKLEVSIDKTNWTEIVHETNADGGNDLFYPGIVAGYIRVQGLKRATQWGHSLWEIQAFGEPTSVNQTSDDANIVLSPNPSDGAFTISGLPKGEQFAVEVFNITGKRILHSRVSSDEKIILPKAQANAGTYLIKITGKEIRWNRHLVLN
jgi:beta-glucosidase